MPPPCLPGEGRDPVLLWAPAFAGGTGFYIEGPRGAAHRNTPGGTATSSPTRRSTCNAKGKKPPASTRLASSGDLKPVSVAPLQQLGAPQYATHAQKEGETTTA